MIVSVSHVARFACCYYWDFGNSDSECWHRDPHYPRPPVAIGGEMQRGRKLFIKVSVALAGLAGGLALMSILLEIQGAFMNGDIYAENGAAFANSPWGWVTVGTIIVGMVIGFPVGIGFWGFVATRMKWLTRAEIDKVLDKDRRRMGRK